MKTKNSLTFIFLLLLFENSAFQHPKYAQDNTGVIELVIIPMVGDKPLFLDSGYVSPNGDRYSLKTLKLFLSDIALSTATGLENKGTSLQSKTGIFLINFNEPNYDGGFGKQSFRIKFNVKAGNYSDIRFNIGVPRHLNHSDPTMASSPLDIGKADMFWTWNTGYIFLLAEGKRLDQNNEIFHFAVGGDSNIMPVSFGNLFNIKPLLEVKNAKTTRVILNLDFNKFLANGDGSKYSFKSEEGAIVHGGYYASVLRNNIMSSFNFVSASVH